MTAGVISALGRSLRASLSWASFSRREGDVVLDLAVLGQRVATGFEAYKGEQIFAKHSEQYLANDWEKLGEYKWPGIEIRRLLEEGEPAEQIIIASHSIPCDFICNGSA